MDSHQAVNPSDLADAHSCVLLQDTAARLKLIRDVFGFSQRELAKRAGVTNSSISMIEQGQVSPSIQSLARILAAFPISLADFFGFKLASEPQVKLAEKLDLRSSSDSFPHQLDARTESLAVGQSTACVVPVVDSCGVVLDGEIQLTLVSGNQLLSRGDSFYIPAGQLFRLINLSRGDASLFRCSLFVHKG